MFVLAFVMASLPSSHSLADSRWPADSGRAHLCQRCPQLKALRSGYSSLGLLMAMLGVSLFMAAWLATPSSVLATSTLEDQVPTIIGTGLGFFSKIEEG